MLVPHNIELSCAAEPDCEANPGRLHPLEPPGLQGVSFNALLYIHSASRPSLTPTPPPQPWPLAPSQARPPAAHAAALARPIPTLQTASVSSSLLRGTQDRILLPCPHSPFGTQTPATGASPTPHPPPHGLFPHSLSTQVRPPTDYTPTSFPKPQKISPTLILPCAPGSDPLTASPQSFRLSAPQPTAPSLGRAKPSIQAATTNRSSIFLNRWGLMHSGTRYSGPLLVFRYSVCCCPLRLPIEAVAVR